MTDQPNIPQGSSPGGQGLTGPAPGGYGPPAPPQVYGRAPALAAGYGVAAGPIGRTRGTGMVILLSIVTLGFYAWYWYYATHEEMKRHSGVGLGGGVALILAIFVSVVMPFLTSNEVGELYTRRGQQPPVSAATGLWVFPGSLLVVLPLVWVVKTNGALNAYWRSLGASG